jgi:hypothetical protein
MGITGSSPSGLPSIITLLRSAFYDRICGCEVRKS